MFFSYHFYYLILTSYCNFLKIKPHQNTKPKQKKDFWKVQFSSAKHLRKIFPFKRKASTFITCIPPDLEAAALTYPTALPSSVLV